MRIVNPGNEDYHIHSFNFSDGEATYNEIIEQAGIFGLTKIAITDHSQALLDSCGYGHKLFRSVISRFGNVHNDVEVIFGVEGDLIDENGKICDRIQDITSDFLILSAHPLTYSGDPTRLTEAYIKAIRRHHEEIKFLGHPCAEYFQDHVDIREVVKAANDHGVALEFNCANFVIGKTNQRHLEIMLTEADRVYVNSDAHTLLELKTVRGKGLQYLREQGLLLNPSD